MKVVDLLPAQLAPITVQFLCCLLTKLKKKKKIMSAVFFRQIPFWNHIFTRTIIFYIFYYVYFFINNLSIQLFLIFFISRVTKFDFTF